MQTAEEKDRLDKEILYFMIAACLLSLLLHIALIIWFYGFHISFGQPLASLNEPARFNVKKSEIDPKSLESEMTPLPKIGYTNQKEPLNMEPHDIEALVGPLQAPRIPTPRVNAEVPVSLSAGDVNLPMETFSALDLQPDGKVPQVAQALVNEASTAALKEAYKGVGVGNLAAGSESTQPSIGVPGLGELSSLVKTTPLPTIERPEKQPILLRLSSDVLFAFNSSKLQSEGEEKLMEILALFKSSIKAEITIEGHTDTLGEDTYNLSLSQTRAQSVADWIISQTGVKPDLLKVKGYGESRPIVNPEGTQEEQALNRRVEIRIQAEK
ncbi:MAG: OmpA family protein [Verrucomicrobiota bacterium]